MKKTGVWQVLRSACVGGWLTAGLFVAVDMGVWAQESLGMAAYDGMSLDAAPNGAAADAAPNETPLDAAPNEMFLGTALDWMSLDAAPKGAVLGAATPGVEEAVAFDRLTDDDKKTYTQAEYIESTKGGGQYINTEYVHKANTKIVCEVSAAEGQARSWAAVFGACNVYWGSNAFAFYVKDEGDWSNFNRTQRHGSGAVFPRNVRTTITCEGRTAEWSTAGGTKGSITLDDGALVDDGTCPLLIFDRNVSGNGGIQPEGIPATMRLYSFRIYEGAELKRDFVPCVSATEGAGLWDRVEGKFYPNKGGTAFNTP